MKSGIPSGILASRAQNTSPSACLPNRLGISSAKHMACTCSLSKRRWFDSTRASHHFSKAVQ
jgi:hypothetical protein